MNYIFLMCSERSGSNLITKIFDSHSQICGPSTAHIADVLCPNLYKYGSFNELTWRSLVEDINVLLDSKNAYWKKTFTLNDLLQASESFSVHQLFDYIYSSEAQSHDKTSVMIKENRIYEFLPFFMQLSPFANYVYMVRDPRDMAASWKHSYSIRGGAVRGAKVWLADQLGFLKARSWLGNDKVPFFKYEDLLQNPEETITKACITIGYNFQPEMLNFYQQAATKENASRAADWRNVDKPLQKDNAGKYSDRLTKAEIQYVEFLCKDLMAAFNYIPAFPLISEEEFIELEKSLLAIEPNVKAAYENETSEAEKLRRKSHHGRSKEIFDKKIDWIEFS
ncbi:sulfotransferase [Shewanella sp. TC10]|uniref:sulfotransferase n=1 Tax=Shewanella sp. TC10 TaxID=1419739 RepID=UPI00129DA060|nr:sulfotransferase [Shewanella sp. TC10]